MIKWDYFRDAKILQYPKVSQCNILHNKFRIKNKWSTQKINYSFYYKLILFWFWLSFSGKKEWESPQINDLSINHLFACFPWVGSSGWAQLSSPFASLSSLIHSHSQLLGRLAGWPKVTSPKGLIVGSTL